MHRLLFEISLSSSSSQHYREITLVFVTFHLILGSTEQTEGLTGLILFFSLRFFNLDISHHYLWKPHYLWHYLWILPLYFYWIFILLAYLYFRLNFSVTYSITSRSVAHFIFNIAHYNPRYTLVMLILTLIHNDASQSCHGS